MLVDDVGYLREGNECGLDNGVNYERVILRMGLCVEVEWDYLVDEGVEEGYVEDFKE